MTTTNGAENEELSMNVVPSILISAASVVVAQDNFNARQRVESALWVQVWLWLAAALQVSPSEDDIIAVCWVHSVFFFHVVHIVCSSWLLRYGWERQAANPQREPFSVTAPLGPSAFIGLVSTTLVNSSASSVGDSWKMSIAVFLITLTVWLAFEWYSRRKHAAREELIGMPTVASTTQFNSGTRSSDETHWEEWKPMDVLQWIGSKCSRTDRQTTICACLAPEFIDGLALSMLTVQDLRSMGISYGDAQWLMNQIRSLKEGFPSRRLRQRQQSDPSGSSYDGPEDPLKDWYEEQDAYSTRASGMKRQRQPSWNRRDSIDSSHQQQHSNELVTDPTMMDSETAARAQSLMKENFGFELPEIRSPHQQREHHPLQTDHVTSALTEMTQGPASHLQALPPEFIESMPPHIVEIAARKPDLVQKILASRPAILAARQQQENPSGLPFFDNEQRQIRPGTHSSIAAAATPPFRVTQHPNPLEETKFGGDECEGSDDSIVGDERTSLLRKRQSHSTNNSTHQYESIIQ